MAAAAMAAAAAAAADAEMADAEAEAEMWPRALADLDADLRALVAHVRAVGAAAEEADEAEDASRAPVGDSELARLRALQFREDAAQELATALRAAGHRSALIARWAEEEERRVRPRL